MALALAVKRRRNRLDAAKIQSLTTKSTYEQVNTVLDTLVEDDKLQTDLDELIKLKAKLNITIPVKPDQIYLCVETQTWTDTEKREGISEERINELTKVTDDTAMKSVTMLKKEDKEGKDDEVKSMWKQDETTNVFISNINTYITKLNKLNTKKKSWLEKWFVGGGHLEQLRADILNHEMETGQRDLEARRHFNALLRARRARD